MGFVNVSVQRGTVYEAPAKAQEVRETRVNLAEIILAKIDSVVEYPGSVKGDFGHWVLTEWVEAKIDQSLKKRGERV